MNLKRFLHRYLLSIIFYGTITLSVILILGCIPNDNTLRSDWEANRQITEIYIKKGDTLWAIAKKHKPSFMDIREYIYEVCKLNNIDNLYAGDVIQIYTWEE